MQITRPLVLAFFLLTGACASTRGDRGAQESAKKPLRGGVAEFHLTSYDGREFVGRILLGATADTLVIDGRLVEDRDVELEKARACGKTEVLEHYIANRFTPPRPDEIVTLTRGYWHGANVFFILSDKKPGLGPDCLEAELVVRVLDGRVAATLPVRVVRTDKPPATPDSAAEAPKPLPSDAGAP